jgi:hypothetical protein
MSQVIGGTTPSPVAPGLTHCIASSLILLIRLLTEGLALLKMQSLRCLQIIQGVRSAREASPFLIDAGLSPRPTSRTGKVQKWVGRKSCTPKPQHLMPDVSGEGAFFFCEKDPYLFHEFTRSTRQPKHNKNYIEVLGPPNDHYCRRSGSRPDIVDDSREKGHSMMRWCMELAKGVTAPSSFTWA